MRKVGTRCFVIRINFFGIQFLGVFLKIYSVNRAIECVEKVMFKG